MTLSFVLFLFLAHLGVGIVFTLVLVGKQAGVKFFRFNAGFAAVLLLVALAMRPEPVRLGTDAQGVALALLLAATAAVLVYWATIGRVLARLRPLWVWTAVLAGGGAPRGAGAGRGRRRAAGGPHRGELRDLGGPPRRHVDGDDPGSLVPGAAVDGRVVAAVRGPIPHRLDGVAHRRRGRRGVVGNRGRRAAGGSPSTATSCRSTGCSSGSGCCSACWGRWSSPT